MPYSKQHNLLFIHIPKNAGKSIEQSLGIRTKGQLLSSQHRSLLSRAFRLGTKLTGRTRNLDSLWGTWDVSLALQHCTYQEYCQLGFIERLPRTDFKTLAVFREPVDRAISTFFHFKRPDETLEDFISRFFIRQADVLDHNLVAHRKSQLDFIRGVDGSICMDYLLHFDELEKSYEKALSNEGFENISLPHITNTRRSSIERSDILTSTALNMIEEIFSDDIEFYHQHFKP